MTTLTTWKNHGSDVAERSGKVYQNAVYWINLTGAQDENYFDEHIPTLSSSTTLSQPNVLQKVVYNKTKDIMYQKVHFSQRLPQKVTLKIVWSVQHECQVKHEGTGILLQTR